MPDKTQNLPPVKKEIVIQSRGERIFALHFTTAEVEAILKFWLEQSYNFDKWDLDLAWENDGSLTVNGHQDIKEG